MDRELFREIADIVAGICPCDDGAVIRVEDGRTGHAVTFLADVGGELVSWEDLGVDVVDMLVASKRVHDAVMSHRSEAGSWDLLTVDTRNGMRCVFGHLDPDDPCRTRREWRLRLTAMGNEL